MPDAPGSVPDVSIVIPVGSVDGLLGEELRAVLAQEFDGTFEVVLSLNTADRAAASSLGHLLGEVGDDRVRVVPSHDARGAAHARNIGAASSVAPILAFCDADDVVEAGWLTGLVRGLDAFDAVSGYATPERFSTPEQARWRPDSTPGGLPTYMGYPYLLSGHLAVRRDAFEAVGGFDTDLTRCEDIAIGWELTRRGFSIGYAPEAILHYRYRAGFGDMMQQAYLYGRGMQEVLMRHGVPDESAAQGGSALIRANNQAVAHKSLVTRIRRCAIAAGRLRCLVGEKLLGGR